MNNVRLRSSEWVHGIFNLKLVLISVCLANNDISNSDKFNVYDYNILNHNIIFSN